MTEPTASASPAPAPKLDTLVVGVDLFDPSLAAAEWVADVVAPEARVILVHAWDARSLRRLLTAEDRRIPERKIEAYARTRLEELRRRIGQERSETQVVEGSAAEALLDVARDRHAVGAREGDQAGVTGERFEAASAYGRPDGEIRAAQAEIGADLVIVGTRAQKRAETIVVGSVSRRVVESSPCPVLVVPPGPEA